MEKKLEIEKNIIDLIKRIRYIDLQTVIKYLKEDQFFYLLQTLIRLTRCKIIDTSVFNFISLFNNSVEINLCTLDLKNISIYSLINFASKNKDLKIIFNLCTFSKNFIEYFINNKCYNGFISLDNEVKLIFTQTELMDINLTNVSFVELEKMINSNFLKKQFFVKCCLNDNVLLNKNVFKNLLGTKRNHIFKYINLKFNSNSCVNKLIKEGIIKYSEKLIINRYLVQEILSQDTKYLLNPSSILRKKGDLSNLNLSGLDLTKINFQNLTDIKGANLSNTKLDENQVHHIIHNMEMKNFSNVDLSNQNFSNTLFKNRNKEKFDLSNCVFVNANLNRTIFCNTDLRNVDFRGAKMFKNRFQGSDIIGANFKNAKLKQAKFDCEQLNLIFNNQIQGINKYKANSIDIVGINSKELKTIDFTDVNMTKFIINDKFIQLILKGEIIGRRRDDLSGLNLSNLYLRNSNIRFNDRINLTNTSFKRTKLNKENIVYLINSKSRGNDINLKKLYLRDIDIEDIDFSGIDFNQFAIDEKQVKLIIDNKLNGRDPNDLTNLDLSFIDLKGIDFTDKDLTNTNLYKAKVDHNFVKLILEGKLIGRQKGDLSGLNLYVKYENIQDLNFNENINLTDTSLFNMAASKELIKLILNNKVIGRECNDLTWMNFYNMDLSDLDFSQHTVNLTHTKFYNCKINEIQMKLILEKKVIGIKGNFSNMDLSGIDLRKFDFSLIKHIYLNNTILSPTQIELVLNNKIRGIKEKDLAYLNIECYKDITKFNFSQNFLSNLPYVDICDKQMIKINTEQAKFLLNKFSTYNDYISNNKLNIDITLVDLCQLNINWHERMFNYIKFQITTEQVKLILDGKVKNLDTYNFQLFDLSLIDSNKLNTLLQKYPDKIKNIPQKFTDITINLNVRYVNANILSMKNITGTFNLNKKSIEEINIDGFINTSIPYSITTDICYGTIDLEKTICPKKIYGKINVVSPLFSQSKNKNATINLNITSIQSINNINEKKYHQKLNVTGKIYLRTPYYQTLDVTGTINLDTRHTVQPNVMRIANQHMQTTIQQMNAMRILNPNMIPIVQQINAMGMVNQYMQPPINAIRIANPNMQPNTLLMNATRIVRTNTQLMDATRIANPNMQPNIQPINATRIANPNMQPNIQPINAIRIANPNMQPNTLLMNATRIVRTNTQLMNATRIANPNMQLNQQRNNNDNLQNRQEEQNLLNDLENANFELSNNKDNSKNI